MKIYIKNMSCMHCVNRISDKLKSEKIKKFDIDLETKTLNIIKTKKSITELKEIINSIGYEFELLEE